MWIDVFFCNFCQIKQVIAAQLKVAQYAMQIIGGSSTQEEIPIELLGESLLHIRGM